MFDIWDHINCEEERCPHYRYYPDRINGDPEQCYPAESECDTGALETGICDMLDALIHNMILDGELETEHGYFIDREWALQVQRGDTESGIDFWFDFDGFDFHSAPYWWIPYESINDVTPYCSTAEIYREYFK